MNEKFKDRKEQRKVTETMDALLLPLLPHLNSDTAIIVERALYLLGEIEIEPQESIEKESIPYLMHKEMGIPISECQKAYDIGIEYLRSQGKLKG